MQTDNLKQLFIPDSSVMIKWCVKEEEDRDQIIRMQKDFLEKKITLLVPLLLEWELNNYLGRNFKPKIATEKYSYYKMLELTGYMTSVELSHLSFEIMGKCPGVTFYDASYHALALSRQGIFLTADKKYYEKAKKMGGIMLLKDYC